MNLTIKEDTELQNKLFSSLKTLSETQVDIGLLPSAEGQLAFILGVQTHGSPIMHIPPRPVVQPALQQPSVRAAIAECFAQSLSASTPTSSAFNTGLLLLTDDGFLAERRVIPRTRPPPSSSPTASTPIPTRWNASINTSARIRPRKSS